MCGIALLLSGDIRIDLSSLLLDSSSRSPTDFHRLDVSVDDIKATLQRRGPDSLGSKKLFLKWNKSWSSVEEKEILCMIEGSVSENGSTARHSIAELQFIGATLQLRGVYPISQPLVDAFGNILAYNGEIYGGIYVDSDSNDTEILMQTLGQYCSCNFDEHSETCTCDGKMQSSVPDVLSAIKGPWAIIYWQAHSKTLWFGRDAFGRRSLLVHWPTSEDSRFLLSSVSPTSPFVQTSEFEVETKISSLNFWEELLCGIYSLHFDASQSDESLLGEVKKHEWTNSMLKDLIEWKRASVEPKPEELHISRCRSLMVKHTMPSACSDLLLTKSAQNVLFALKESVMRRTSQHTIFQGVPCDTRQKEFVPVAVLFSGGLDSMILAVLLNDCLDPSYDIDLLNVSFDGQSAPDRISAEAGLEELKRIAPLRRWKLVETDADLSKLTSEIKHVMTLINPANTYMDLNIGIALWLAAGGDGWLYKRLDTNNDDGNRRVKYKSNARILLVGNGADEQCAGYGRHKTKYRNGSWHGLYEEMKLDMQRIWKRNLGRDDRCIADNGKEARFPFLDEDVIKTLLDIPLWEVADLDQPSGIGDKKILREVAHLLGLHEAATLPKRAIQFGSRIARESNRKTFGSNRAANQASAGSLVIQTPTDMT
ncbi:Asn_synthase domain-containing protein/GATase_7 domain-containing protein [Cephalotus follicularis]|uniref:Asn_synthase domain-containing protein/GATase_7 domain-containing protein n=1 Tax=Cephalotus follicularis TaxID=3775 RepID=A0A1Q3B0V5_CEPFO|nr:Asn_synthase domain-containing protein/GATase_7 domain-containing protein [Cephalotus follicularis]